MADERKKTLNSEQKNNSFVAKFKSKITKATSGTSSNSEELAGRVLALVRLPPRCKEDSEKLLAIRRLLQKGAPPNYCHLLDKMAALHIASLNGDYFAAKELIYFGADVNLKDGLELSPLHLAARMGQNDVISLLLENGADIDLQNRMGETALHEAAVQWCPDTIRVLLYQNASTALAADHANTHINFGSPSPLSYAVHARRLECVLAFLQNGKSLHTFQVIPFLKLAHDKCINLKVLQLLVEADLMVQPVSEVLQVCDRHKFILWPEEFWNWLESPRPLNVLCRQLIRNVLGQGNLSKAKELPLPQTVTDRLSYFWPDCMSCVNLCSKQKRKGAFNIYNHRLPCQCL